jgi:hypothetical protein
MPSSFLAAMAASGLLSSLSHDLNESRVSLNPVALKRSHELFATAGPQLGGSKLHPSPLEILKAGWSLLKQNPEI